jgi:uncharacterized protein
MKTRLFLSALSALALLSGGCASAPPPPVPAPAAETFDLVDFREAEIARTAFDPQSGAFVTLLRVRETGRPSRLVPIIIGEREAQILHMKTAGEVTMRPMTHDLTVALLEKLGARLEFVVVEDMREGVFLARIVVRNAANTLLSLDSRASDAIILAVTAGKKVYVHREVVEKTGVVAPDEEEAPRAPPVSV